jgi:hypothetical protein
MELRPGKFQARATELRLGETPALALPGEKLETNNEAIPEAALADRLRMKFDWEFSRAIWERPPPNSYFVFEEITVARDQVLELRAAPVVTTGPAVRRRGGRAPQFNWDEVFAVTLALLEQEGWPDVRSRRQYAGKIYDACADAGMEPIPDTDTLREKLSVWLSRRTPRQFPAISRHSPPENPAY